jgi:3-keto-disaccharide hydrolase
VKTLRLVLFALIVIVPSALCTSAQVPGPAGSASPFLGRWDLTLVGAGHEYPSWIEIGQKDGNLTALFTGRWGNARPLPKVTITGTQITFVSPKEEEGSKADLIFEGELKGQVLSGTVNGPDGTTWKWTGVKAPVPDKKIPFPQWDKPIQLLNGKDLSGWHESQAGPPDWTVKDGNLISPGNGPELISDRKFQDFKLHVEFNCGKDSNSGVYLRGRYEVQIETESQGEPNSHHTGGVYGFLAPTPELPRTPDVWQSFDITLIGRTVKVILNGQTVIDNQEIPGLTGGALDSHESEPGPIYLQGSEKGHVLFRNITVTPAK